MKDNFFKTILLILSFILFAIMMNSCHFHNPPEKYQINAKVQASSLLGTQILKDADGNLWEVNGCIIPIDTELLLDMNTNGTYEDKTDDYIERIWCAVDPIL